ncbi:MAG: LptF/LptG family permease [Phycisphaeraceae bacterium]
MPWTLYRHMLVELTKLLVVTTVVLVTVISFAAAVKPLSEGLLGPTALARFIFYSAPTMLAFALPFAAAFASTLVFIRMANDNEVLACSASGLSYRTVLLPPALLGLALTMGLFATSNFVIPYFHREARQSLERDLITLLVTDLNAGKAFDRMGDHIIYADRAEERPAPPMPELSLQPDRLIELTGVAVAELGRDNQVRSDYTAQRANVLLFRRGDQSWITMRLHELRYSDPVRGMLSDHGSLDIGTIELPNPMSDKPKFFSLPQLRIIADEPEQYDRVRERRDELVEVVTAERLRQQVRGALDDDRYGHTATLGSSRPGDYYTLHAPRVTRNGGELLLEARGDVPVTVHAYDDGRPAPFDEGSAVRRYEAERALVVVEHVSVDAAPSLRVELSEARIYDARLAGRFTERSALTLPRLLWPDRATAEEPSAMSLEALIKLAGEPNYRGVREVGRAVSRLNSEINELAFEIVALQHDRAASAVACMLLTLLGAVLSIHLRGQMTLVVYFWSFMLAIVTILLIYAGENIATKERFPLYAGLGVLWSGNVLLAMLIGWVYCRLARN